MFSLFAQQEWSSVAIWVADQISYRLVLLSDDSQVNIGSQNYTLLTGKIFFKFKFFRQSLSK